MSYKQAQLDYEYLFEKYNDPLDFCGSFCNTSSFFDLLKNPTKKNAKFIYTQLIIFFSVNGAENGKIDSEDKRTKQIFEKYTK